LPLAIGVFGGAWREAAVGVAQWTGWRTRHLREARTRHPGDGARQRGRRPHEARADLSIGDGAQAARRRLRALRRRSVSRFRPRSCSERIRSSS